MAIQSKNYTNLSASSSSSSTCQEKTIMETSSHLAIESRKPSCFSSLSPEEEAFTVATWMEDSSSLKCESMEDNMQDFTVAPPLTDATPASFDTVLKHKDDGKKQRKEVCFGTLVIHEHALLIGGAGVPRSGGASVTLSWEAHAHFEVPVEEYDSLKAHSRRGEELLYTKSQRVTTLLDLGYTMREINESAAQSTEIRNQRLRSAKTGPLGTLKGVIRSMSRLVSKTAALLKKT